MMLRPLRLHYVLKQFSVRAKTGKLYYLLARFLFFNPDQKSIAFNMALHVSCVVSLKFMRTNLWG